MKKLTVAVLMTVVACGAEDTMESLRGRYFRLVGQWNAANTQLVQLPLYKQMQQLVTEVSQVREQMTKLCKPDEELKDIPVSSDPVEGAEPSCVKKVKPAESKDSK